MRCGHPNHGNPDHDCAPFQRQEADGEVAAPYLGHITTVCHQPEGACEMCGNDVEHRNPVIPHRNAIHDADAWFWVCGRCKGVIRDRVRNVALERRVLLAEPRPIWRKAP